MFVSIKPRRVPGMEKSVTNLFESTMAEIHQNDEERILNTYPDRGIFTSPVADEHAYYAASQTLGQCDISLQIPLNGKGHISGRPRLVIVTPHGVHAISQSVSLSLISCSEVKRAVRKFWGRQKLIPPVCMKDIIEFPRASAGFHPACTGPYRIFIVRS